MAALARSFVFVSLLFVCGAIAHESKATPIQTVIELLESLIVKVTEDGKKEATIYDDFACFCKAQADDKQYAIESSTKLILEMEAKISYLNIEITDLATEIKTLSKTITTKEGDKKKELESRAEEHAKFLEEKEMLTNGIAAVENAIEVLSEAKGNLVDAKLTGSLLQKVRPVLDKILPGQVALLEQIAGQPGSPAKYQYQGNKLLETLAGILETFKKNLKEMELTEFKAKETSDDKVLLLTNEIAFATTDKEAAVATEAAKKEELESTTEQNDAEKAAKKADQAFLAVLVDECQAKAHQWDGRSLLRANELKALSDATEVLKSGALDNFKANKKLVDLQVRAKHESHGPQTFLQIRRVKEHGQSADQVVQKVQALLATSAERLSSSVLTAAAVKVLVSKDHFVKVRGLIKDLIAKLKADAAAEATQKSFCDKAMAKNLAGRDKASANIETATAEIDKLEAANAKLSSEIATLSAEISDLRSALTDATALRNGEKEENEETVKMSDEGKEAVKTALTILDDFYGDAAKSALVQTQSGYVPPNADRDGKSIDDYRSEIFTTKYKGEQTASVGIIGILQTILSDFDRTSDTTRKTEKMSEVEFQKYKKATEKDIDAKQDDIKAKEGSIADNDEKLVTQKSDLKAATALKEISLKALDDLKKSCVDGEETYEERVKKREEEIAALKQALQILIDWQA